MSRKWYGSLQNRLEENKSYCEEITVGTGMTEYSWSDRHAYEVTRVIDQKHVYVREYDHRKKEGAEWYSNSWELVSNPDRPELYITKRGNYWYWTTTLYAHELEGLDMRALMRLEVAGFDLDKVRTKGKQTKYTRVNVTFGVADYYYDYEF